MRGDVVRGLIELITNSDDAYGESRGKILIEVERRKGPKGPWKLTVRDRAKGMRSNFMEEALLKLGRRTSGFEKGEKVRGNRGRGAKDLAAFGPVTFESIRDDHYSKLRIDPTGAWALYPEHKVTEEDRSRLGIPRGNGTVVTVDAGANVRCPQYGKLKERLSRHNQLRDILSDDSREVILHEVGKGTKDVLRYQYPSLPSVFANGLQVAGYPGAIAHVKIYRSSERFDDPPSDPCRPGGLLIKGRRAVYESTLFGLEDNPHAGWFVGEVRCEYIDTLADDYDTRFIAGETAEESNPFQIIKRSRDGLHHAHPFFERLGAAVEIPLAALVEQEERKASNSSNSENPRMRRVLDELGRDLARLIDEDFSEIDDEGLPPSDIGMTYVEFIPPNPILYMNEDKTVTIRVRKDLAEKIAKVSADPEGVVEILDSSDIELSRHRRRDELLTGQVRLRPLVESSEALLTATVGEHSCVGLAEVRPERVFEEVPIEMPEGLQFERDIYRVAWNKTKRIRIVAPPEIIVKHGTIPMITSSNDGIVVRGGLCELELNEDVEFYAAEVIVEARELGARGTIRAELGNETAICTIVVSRDEQGPGIEIRIVNEEAGNRRALVERDGDRLIMKIMGRHAAFKRYRGIEPDFRGEELAVCKSLVAEIVAHEAVRIVMEKRYSAVGSGLLDAASLYAEHTKYLSKYLLRCHRRLILDADLKEFPLAAAGGNI